MYAKKKRKFQSVDEKNPFVYFNEWILKKTKFNPLIDLYLNLKNNKAKNNKTLAK